MSHPFRLRVLVLGVFLSLASSLVDAAETDKRPNVIFILADDLGWAELGCYGNGFNETPHLDRLASQGMRFTQAYAAAPVCSPYRAALLTGQHPARTGILDYLRPNSANSLSTDHVTLAEMFRKNGYSTGMVGKWHLTGYRHHDAEYEVRPKHHCFQWNFASEVKGVGNGANFWPYVFRDQAIRWIDIPENRLGNQEYLTDRMNLEAIDFVERNRDRPFFLYLSHYAPHTILNGRPDLVAKYRRKHKPGASTRTRCYLCMDHGHEGDALHHWAGDHNPHLAAMLESIDDGIGRIAAKLDELGIADNTIMIFTSDNGGETNVTSNAPLRGGKSQLYEGGIRVPLIVRWPDAVPAKTVCRQPTVNLDFYPTLLQAAGIERDKKQKLDGVSTLATWKNPTKRSGRDALYWHYPLDRPHFLGGASSGAIRAGDWKLIEYFDSGRRELYSLADDVSEARDLAADKPEVVARLTKKLKDWRRGIDARLPSPPLLASPRQLSFADHFSPLPVHDPEKANGSASASASDRWFFNEDWSAEGGVLQRGETGSSTTRIFLRGITFKDVVIRFDFQLRQSQDIRLVTGASGHYNAVLHIRPDHFYVQTALDRSGPWFSYRHGECAYDFAPDRWYTMTVEFIGDQLVAHVDRDHLAYAKHPILDKERSYFALQVDKSPAAFDNVQILKAAKHARQDANLQHIAAVEGKYPVEKPIAEQFEIQKRNAHEWFYQRHEAYRALVKQVDELDAVKKKRFPEVFRSNKEFRERIKSLRRKLHAEDPAYKETLFATFRADRAITAWLIQQAPEVGGLPDSRRKREIERLRVKRQDQPEYRKLVASRNAAQKKLEAKYPQLFRTDEQIKQYRKMQREKVAKSADFQELAGKRAAAYRAQQDYLFEHDKKLAELRKKLDKDRASLDANYRIDTIAGDGSRGDTPDRADDARRVPVDLPFGVEFGPDGGLYVTTVGSHRVLRVDLKSGRLESVAGNGRRGYSGDGGPATRASLNEPYEVRFDSRGHMIILEMKNHLIRRVDRRTGAISTVAGDGVAGDRGDGGPARKARFRHPHSIVFDKDDNLFVSDLSNHRVRQIDARTGLVQTMAGNGERGHPKDGARADQQPLITPQGLAIHDGHLWIASFQGQVVWRMNLKSREIHRVAGDGRRGHSGDGGDPLKATFDGPRGVAMTPGGGLYVVEGENNVLRLFDTRRRSIRTIAGVGPKRREFAGDKVAARQAPLWQPHGVCVAKDGTIFLSDTINHRVRRLTPIAK